MDLETLGYEKKEGIAYLTLNRPDRLNAINGAMSRELPKVWEDIKQDGDVVVAIVTGAGDRGFCTGVDVAGVAAGDADIGEPGAQGLDAIRFTSLHNQCWKPVITAVNGMCVGGGLHFVADSDIVICSENATFFDTHVRNGLVAGLEPVGLARRIPLEAVLRMALMGGKERLNSAKALELGLVSEVVPLNQLLPRATFLANLIQENSPAALVATKKAIWQSLDMGLDDALKNAWAIIEAHNDHPDILEGAKAFMEKRKPKWKPVSL